MLALVRNYLHIPCRYVSGYLYHRRDDRSADGATHAWLQAWLPELGWIGFDPTNNLLQGERHIEVALGREYSDVPPTRGVYKGNAGSELAVTVRIRTEREALPDAGLDGADPGDTDLGDTPIYRSTEQALQERYAQALLAMEMQQQQQAAAITDISGMDSAWCWSGFSSPDQCGTVPPRRPIHDLGNRPTRAVVQCFGRS